MTSEMWKEEGGGVLYWLIQITSSVVVPANVNSDWLSQLQ